MHPTCGWVCQTTLLWCWMLDLRLAGWKLKLFLFEVIKYLRSNMILIFARTFSQFILGSYEILVNVQTSWIHNNLMNVWYALCDHNSGNITQQEVATVESIILPSYSLLHSIKGELSRKKMWMELFFSPLNILYHCSAWSATRLRFFAIHQRVPAPSGVLQQCSSSAGKKGKEKREYNDV